jgi:hypothetical protein
MPPKQSNDAARLLMRYLGHVGIHRSDEHFAANVKAMPPEQRLEMIRNCRAAAFKMGLIGMADGKPVLTQKGLRFAPIRPATPEELARIRAKPTKPASAPTA